jgi:glycosyltransferase involved in cell wall biosynthesis
VHVGLDLLFLDPGRSGGRETYARELLKAFRGRVEVTAFVNRETQGAWAPLVDRTVVLPGVSVRSRWRWAVGELLLLPKAARGIDVLHAPANFGPLHGDVPRVLTVHDLHFRVHPETVEPVARLATELMVPPAARRATRVITESATARSELERELRLRDVVVIPAGVTPPRPAPPADLGDGPIVLCVATNLPHKDLPTAIEAMRRVPEARLVLVGAGTEALGGLGAVPDVEPYYARADALLTPTLHEGFGLPVLEAMARGIPVACTDLPVLREVAGRHAAYFPPRDAPAAALAVRAALAAGPSEAARAHAASFSWETAATATLGVYRAALAARR